MDTQKYNPQPSNKSETKDRQTIIHKYLGQRNKQVGKKKHLIIIYIFKMLCCMQQYKKQLCELQKSATYRTVTKSNYKA